MIKDFDQHYIKAIDVFNKKLLFLNENLSYFKHVDTFLPELESNSPKYSSPFGTLLGIITKNQDLMISIEDSLIYNEVIVLANGNDVDSQYDLAIMYYHGHGIDEDRDKAVYWLIKAANNNYPIAQYDLAEIYAEGILAPYDPVKAEHYRQLALDAGQTSGGLLDIGNDYLEASIESFSDSITLPLIPSNPNLMSSTDLKFNYTKLDDTITLSLMIMGFLTDFLDGSTNSTEVNMDHIVILSESIEVATGTINEIVFKLLTYGANKKNIDFHANINASMYNMSIN
jgi:hypothetical protein